MFRTLTALLFACLLSPVMADQRAETQQQLDAAQKDVAELKKLLEAIQKEKSGVQGELKKTESEMGQLEKQVKGLQQELNKDLSARDQKLKARQQEQAQLGNVLKTIEATLARQAREAAEARKLELAAEQARLKGDKASPGANGPLVSSSGATYGGNFASARGKLPWPVNGRLAARFGTARGGDERTKWDGVLISAGAGSQVHAVHGGRVVFADWLRGAGLLVILDHGNGYLSLYGHNQSLLKDAGQIVKAGEAIATVGTSGGQNTPALYFAIRQQGRPSDPAQWCRRQG